MSAPLKLYSYFRSSASYRVRIGLNLKGLAYEYVPVHLVREGGDQYKDGYRGVNPMSEVPSLVLEDGTVLAQSVAILEYLDETHPTPPLLPKAPVARARVRQLVQAVNASIQPIQNLRVMNYLSAEFGTDRAANVAWGKYWIARGFEGLEALAARGAGRFAFGDDVTMADIYLVPQVYNAERFGCDMSRFPTLARVAAEARALDAFARAAPEVQPDTPAELRA